MRFFSSKSPEEPDPRKKIFIGLCLIISSFVTATGVIYLLVAQIQEARSTAGDMQEQVTLLSTQNDMLEREIAANDGSAIKLNRLVDNARDIHGLEEEQRTEGTLWVDRGSRTAVITLGALNGLTLDSRLQVLAGEQAFDEVKIDTLLDVIAYVTPVNRPIDEYTKDYYQVVYEQ